ncbi:sulfakinin receptor-like protein, partial [Dinothrombium tinctorium]
AVAVCVTSWTLVSVSVERYYAICHPFKSRELRQNWTHIYKVIGSVWSLSLFLMSPIVFVSVLQPTANNSGNHQYFSFHSKLYNIENARGSI